MAAREEQRWNRGIRDQARLGSYKEEAVMVEAAQLCKRLSVPLPNDA